MPVVARLCGFKSHLLHEKKAADRAEMLYLLFFIIWISKPEFEQHNHCVSVNFCIASSLSDVKKKLLP